MTPSFELNSTVHSRWGSPQPNPALARGIHDSIDSADRAHRDQTIADKRVLLLILFFKLKPPLKHARECGYISIKSNHPWIEFVVQLLSALSQIIRRKFVWILLRHLVVKEEIRNCCTHKTEAARCVSPIGVPLP